MLNFFWGRLLCIKMLFLRWPQQTNFEFWDSDCTHTKLLIGVFKVGGQFLRKPCQWINFLGRLCGNCEFHNIMALEQFSKSNCTSFISCQRTVKNCSRNLNILYRKTKLFERWNTFFQIETVQISTYSSHPQKLAPQDPQEDCHDEYIRA